MTTPTATIFVPYHALEEAIGQWVDVPFSAANFTSAAGSWTVEAGDVVSYAYTVIGQTLIVEVHLALSTVLTGAGTQLAVHLPPAFVVARQGTGLAVLFNGTWQLGSAIAVPGASHLIVQRADVGAFVNAADFGCSFTVTCSVA